MPINKGRFFKAGGGGGAAGAGDVVGPAASTDEALVRFDGATGKLLQDGLMTETDAGVVSGATQLNVDNLRLDGNTISSTNADGDITLDANGTGDVRLISGNAFSSRNGTVISDGSGEIPIFVRSGVVLGIGAPLSVSAAWIGEFNYTTGLHFPSTLGVDWDSATEAQNPGFADTGLRRSAAGVLKVTDGSTGKGWVQQIGDRRNTADQTVTNTTTLANSTDLTLTLVAGRTYHFRAYLHFTTINTSGAKVAISGAATHTNIIYDVTFFGISTPSFLTSGRAVAKDTAVGVTASGTSCYAIIEGTTTVNAGGAFTVQFAQNAETGAAESVILLRGSTLTVRDIA